MPPDQAQPNRAYLWDMLNAARDTIEIVADADLETFSTNKRIYRVVERSLEILGEAAKRVSDEFRHSTPQIRWQEIIGQRNIIAHDYGQID